MMYGKKGWMCSLKWRYKVGELGVSIYCGLKMTINTRMPSAAPGTLPNLARSWSLLLEEFLLIVLKMDTFGSQPIILSVILGSLPNLERIWSPLLEEVLLSALKRETINLEKGGLNLRWFKEGHQRKPCSWDITLSMASTLKLGITVFGF